MCRYLNSLISVSVVVLSASLAAAQETPEAQPAQPPAEPEAAAASPEAPAPAPVAQEESGETEPDASSEPDPAVASAEAASERRAQTPSMVSVMGKLGFVYSSGLGASVRYRYAIVPEGWIKKGKIRDDFGLEFGGDYMSYTIKPFDWSLTLIELYATATWNVWFTENFAAYPRAGLGFGISSIDTGGSTIGVGSYGGIYGVGGVGILYALGSVRLRAELANRDLNLGAAFTF